MSENDKISMATRNSKVFWVKFNQKLGENAPKALDRSSSDECENPSRKIRHRVFPRPAS
jgi:hypothetical protein